MLRLQWNALRVGSTVLVHDPRDTAMRLLPGVVAMVQTLKGSNDVGVRVAPGDEPRHVLWPARLAVHLDPLDPTESCWRCDAIAAAGASAPGATARGGP